MFRYSTRFYLHSGPCNNRGAFLIFSLLPPRRHRTQAISSTTLCLGNDALNISDTLVQDLLQDFGVLKLLFDLGDDGLGQLLLLTSLDLTLVTDPAVEDGLCFVGEVGLLLELVGLGLETGSFLEVLLFCYIPPSFEMILPYL